MFRRYLQKYISIHAGESTERERVRVAGEGGMKEDESCIYKRQKNVYNNVKETCVDINP